MKKAVFLFGAGAVLDWQAPSTSFLTDLIRKIGFKTKKSVTVTESIYIKLVGLGVANQDINFETIINFIEELYNYSSLKTRNKPVASLYSFTDLDELIQELAFFEVINRNEVGKSYSLSILGGYQQQEDYISYSISPEEKYFELLLVGLIGGIIGHISKYSYYTQGHNVFLTEEKKAINESFLKWMQSYYNNGYALRIYTLNYDRLFKVLLSENGIDVFEGFDVEHPYVGYGDDLIPNIPKIVSDFECNCHYNLHGSAYWHIEELNLNQLPGYQFYLTSGPNIENPTAVIEIEKGKKILISNVITGFQKVQKTGLSPFRQMYSAFDRDCIEADEIFIVGYSYGDEHVNDIIRNARKYNSHVNISLISPSFDDEKIMIEFLLHWGRPTTMIYQNVGADIIDSHDYKVRAIKKTFSTYLNDFFKDVID